MSPGSAGSLQPDLFAPADSAGVMEVAAGAVILNAPAKPARVPERPAPRRPDDHALLVRLLERGGRGPCDSAEAAAALLDRFGDIRTTVVDAGVKLPRTAV